MLCRRNTKAATGCLHTAGVEAVTGSDNIMFKVIAVSIAIAALAGCSSYNRTSSMGNAAETKNSSDANKSQNPAAVSPGPAGTTGSGAGGGTGSGGGGGTGSAGGAR